jgi:hypothetical protein
MVCLLAGALASAQAPQAPSPPGQQQLAMGYFAGSWKITGTTKISPSSPAVEFNATANGEWVPGNYFLEIKSKTHGPLGEVNAVRMMEYNSSDHVYTFNEYNSLGEHVIGIGRIQGPKTWLWNTTKKLNGIAAKGRYITTFITDNSYSFQSQVQKPGVGWLTVTQGTATRVPSQNQ